MSPLLAQLTYYIAMIGGLLGAMYLGSSLGSESYETVVMVFLGIIGLLWIIGSGDAWWMPMMFAIGIGGVFQVPFKVFPHELALVVCGVALLPRIPFKPADLKKVRERLPLAFSLVGFYLVGHYSISLLETGGAGAGNISRAYMHALWPIIFGLAFYWYGTSKNLATGLRIFYFALLIRMGFGLVNYFIDDVIIVPVLNYSINPQDLRTSGYMLVVLAGMMMFATQNPIARVFHGSVLIIATYAWLLGGSRALLAGLIILIGVIFVLLERWVSLAVSFALTVLFIAILNLGPSLIEPLPYTMQRSLLGLIVGETVEIDVQQDVKGSDQFRKVISEEGFRRWSESPRSVTFGAGIRPFDENFFLNAHRFEMDPFTLLIQNAADVGAYETAFWTVLAVTGLVGAILFSWLLLAFAARLVWAVRELPMQGAGRALVVWAAGAQIAWFLTCYIFGAFPSMEIFLGILALGYVEDRKRELGIESKVAEKKAAQARDSAVRQPELVEA